MVGAFGTDGLEEKSELLNRAEGAETELPHSSPLYPRRLGQCAWSPPRSEWQRKAAAAASAIVAVMVLGYSASLLGEGHGSKEVQTNAKVAGFSRLSQEHRRHIHNASRGLRTAVEEKDEEEKEEGEEEEEVRPLADLQEPVFPLSANMAGVNFGGWLCLEDWFFSGSAGEYVDSGWPFTGQGACLPSKLNRVDQPWQSEGTLTKQLGDDAAKVLEDFRKTFITEADWQQAAALGITSVRVPITWAAFADALATAAPDVYGKHDPDKDTAIVPDPYYTEELAFATIPRNFMRNILESAHKYDIRVIWDIHAFMGGSSNGTYTGVWPNPPMFWQGKFNVGNVDTTLSEAGLWIVAALVKWIEEGLSPEQRDTIQGVCLMNEPAHLSNANGWADQGQVLDWVKQASDIFRWSTLSEKGIKLYVNVVETAFPYSGDTGFDQVVPSWWSEHFSVKERSSWAVFDRHKYWTWEPECNGCDEWQDGQPMCAWTCGMDRGEVENLLRGCISRWKDNFVAMFPDGLKAISEFSAGTWRHAQTACRDLDLTRWYFQAQVEAFREIGIEPFFWTWKMPYGANFQTGWSLKSITGIESDAPRYDCGAPDPAGETVQA